MALVYWFDLKKENTLVIAYGTVDLGWKMSCDMSHTKLVSVS